ncbi:peptidylprolyl isomerase [Methanoculleus sp. FWC-SCC3]|uniref:Peptidyl-prolyl cis-trans isomerase n=1 Tax=Methanoculleus methanifontis TaxID=2584086 RepID=A0ABT8M1N9_9EURY|nr:peptidylprolyl isomerase [Methanoculleus sp. FWC-SCC3]MDN7012949.1 peptidylprolyl isomerase [Methanoculleus sp. FWC-SCC3]
MALQEGDFIRLRYTGRVGENIFDTTDEENAKEEGIYNPRAEYGPVTVRLGSHHIIVGLEDELIGKEVGAEGEIDVPPEKAFGAHEDEAVKSVPVTQFREKPQRGMRIEVEGREGVVVDVIGRRAVVDFNHPLAGKTLNYSYAILEKVEEPVEQIKGLIKLFSGRTDIGISIAGGTAELELPPAITYDRRWMVWRGTLVREIFENYSEINDVVMKETISRPEKPVPEVVEAEEAPEPAETEETEETKESEE